MLTNYERFDAIDWKKHQIINGGIGTECQRQGIPLHPIYWSGIAHLQHPLTVRNIYLSYLRSGAKILTTNTFSSARHLIRKSEYRHQYDKVIKQSVEIVRDAIEMHGNNEPILIAGSISPIPDLTAPHSLPTSGQDELEFEDQVGLLMEFGVDFILAEMVIASDAVEMFSRVCQKLEAPLLLGLSASTMETDDALMAFRAKGKYRDLPSETFESLTAASAKLPVQGLGIMHTKPDLMDSALQALRQHWKGISFAYAETGTSGDHDWSFESAMDTETYRSLATTWKSDYRLNFIGGCCGTTPEHILAINKQAHEH